MKLIAITLLLPCQDDVPSHVVEWMAKNLAEHAMHEFEDDYEPSFGEGYEGPPLIEDVRTVAGEATPLEIRTHEQLRELQVQHVDLFDGEDEAS